MHDKIRIAVRVQPRASCSEISGIRNKRLNIRTTAAPADGKANKDVALQLAKAFEVPGSRVLLHSGASSRNKCFVIERPERLPEWLADLRCGDDV
jgi:uncharacterized protein (TIGR00251 family)